VIVVGAGQEFDPDEPDDPDVPDVPDVPELDDVPVDVDGLVLEDPGDAAASVEDDEPGEGAGLLPSAGDFFA